MIRLFTTAYPISDSTRRQEINECLQNNLNQDLIDEVNVLCEGSPALPASGKLKIREVQSRPILQDYIDWVNEIAAPDDISIIANADIYFGQSIQLAITELRREQCWALARWDDQPAAAPILFDRNDSQDAWVFRGPILPLNADFPLGVVRCDNRFLFELQNAGYEVRNPAFSIQAYHRHFSPQRHYDVEHKADYVDPPYRYLWPHNLWPLAKTISYNATAGKGRIPWRFDQRKFAATLPVRAIRKLGRVVGGKASQAQ